MSPLAARPPAERFWEKVDLSGDCWLWLGRLDRDGYGVFWRSHDGPVRAHRFAYEHSVGPIPDGLQLDHLCRVRACVRPEHLEPVACRENLMRGDTLAAANAAKTHCPQGHPYTPENTYRAERGDRQCRTCRKERSRTAAKSSPRGRQSASGAEG